MLSRIMFWLVTALLGPARPAGASAEWCEHDDIMLHDVVNGKNLAIHVRVQQLSAKAQLKDWSGAGNVRLWTTTDMNAAAIQVVGPQHEWKAEVFANHGYKMVADPEKVYNAGQTVVFILKAA